ncbi:uncharacterized protein LOC122088196 isoform X2 [Macadamia integrifolia]|uniref:uncharacterized protein LOC122088196 isoform X2 n=1 Tax=Macadamia integrifolia TaxID=60698 RepID=UPI001C4EC00B|nr:uncharacterized protein LOC122088196 isoform X2 [Macadamia integrifolia]XP_042513318.1 uncharacterized protein LOC122088196 isoform X2 [Macadamia integrifolia]
MFRLLCGRTSQLRWVGDYSSRLCFLQTSSLRFNSSAANESTLTSDFLINSCGLSPESALRVSKSIDLKTTAKADSVVALFKDYGFTQPQISNIITFNPNVLRVDPMKKLKPKIELLRDMGISGTNLAKILTRYANFLTASLERELVPNLEFIRSFIDTNERFAITLTRLTWCTRLPEIMTPNIEILRDHGVTESNISRLMFLHPRLLIWKSEQFKWAVLRVKEMGLEPSSSPFIPAFRVLSGMKNPTWEAKLAVFSSFGWSSDDILFLFRKLPTIFGLSEKRIGAGLDFFMNKLNWTIADIMKYPGILQLSLEKRIFPRFSVIQVLLVKGLMKKKSIGTAMRLTEDKFLNKYMIVIVGKGRPH